MQSHWYVPSTAFDNRWAAGMRPRGMTALTPSTTPATSPVKVSPSPTRAEAFAGWSTGRVDGWVQRYSVGTSLIDDRYSLEVGRVPPTALPPDETGGPFVRYELIEDRFEKLQNRNLMARPEFFALGLAATVQLGWAGTSWGSTRDTLLYARVDQSGDSNPHRARSDRRRIHHGTMHSDGRSGASDWASSPSTTSLKGRRWLFYASVSADTLTNLNPAETLELLGGDNGLRATRSDIRTASGRALVTVEERFFTDAYVWRLFRIGSAAFYDVGRAWGGNATNTVNPGWLQQCGRGPTHRERSRGVQQCAPRGRGVPAQRHARHQRSVPRQDEGQFR